MRSVIIGATYQTVGNEQGNLHGAKGNASCAVSALFPARYVLSFLTFWAISLEFAHRVCLSVTIVAMVNQTAVVTTLFNVTNSYCPYPEADNETSFYETGEYVWSPTTQGIILGAYFYGFVCTQLIGGRLAELFGGKWLLGGAILSASLLTLATPFAANIGVPAIFSVRVGMGLVHGICLPAAFAMFAHWAPVEERSTLLSFCVIGDHVGTVLSMPLAGYLCEEGFSGGWPSVFYVLGTLGCIWFLFWTILVHNCPEDHPRISLKEFEYIKKNQDNVSVQQKTPVPWKKILTSLPVWSIAIATFTTGWGYTTLITKLPTYLEVILHVPIQKNGIVNSFVYVSGSTTLIFSGYISDYFRSKDYFSPTTVRKVFQFLAMTGPCVCTALLPNVGCNKGAAVALLVIAMTCLGLTGGGHVSIAMDMAPQYAGTIFGFANGIGCTTGILSPLVAGLLLDDGHGNILQWSLVFYISAGMYLLGALVFILAASAELQPWAADTTYKKYLSEKEHLIQHAELEASFKYSSIC